MGTQLANISTDNAVLDKRKPEWARYPGETSHAYALFCKFRDTPVKDRRITMFGSYGGKLANRFKWRERLKSYEAHLAELKEQLNERAALEFHAKTIDLGTSFIDKAKKCLPQVIANKADDVVNLAETGLRIGRIALGLSPDGEKQSAPQAPHSNTVNVLVQGSGPAWLKPKEIAVEAGK